MLPLLVSLIAAEPTVNTGPGSHTRPATTEELDAAFGAALETRAGKRLYVEGMVAQIRANAPIAVVDGAWVIPVDRGDLLDNPRFGKLVVKGLPALGVSLPGGDIELPGLALVPDQLVREIGAGWRDDVYADMGKDLEKGLATDFWWWVAGGAVAVGVLVYEQIVLTDTVYENGYERGRIAAYNEMNPDADRDADGKTNAVDDDDDNDGVLDKDDRYPYDKDRSICDLCGRTSGPGAVGMSNATFFTPPQASAGTDALLGEVLGASLQAMQSGAAVSAGAVAGTQMMVVH